MKVCNILLWQPWLDNTTHKQKNHNPEGDTDRRYSIHYSHIRMQKPTKRNEVRILIMF